MIMPLESAIRMIRPENSYKAFARETLFRFTEDFFCLAPWLALFSQRSELATACTSRMQIKDRTKRIGKASKAKQISN